MTCYKAALPQGAPTSPIIANLVAQIMDNRILTLAKEYRLNYTRYADDLTFSTNDKKFISKEEEFKVKLENIINKSDFLINDKRTRM